MSDEITAAPQTAKKTKDKNADRFMIFTLGADAFAIPLLVVKEVIAVPDYTPMPFVPPHFVGIINLRGQVISVMDLRIKLGVKAVNTEETAVIITDLAPLTIGIIVDSVESVIRPTAEEIATKPEVDHQKNSEFITAVCRKDNRLVMFIDIARALDTQDLVSEHIRNLSQFAA